MIVQHFDRGLVHRLIAHLDEAIAEIDVFARTQLFTETLSSLVRLPLHCQAGRTDWRLHAPVHLAEGETAEVNALRKERFGFPRYLTTNRADLRMLQFAHILFDPIRSWFAVVIKEKEILARCCCCANIACFSRIVKRMSLNCLDRPAIDVSVATRTHK